MRASFWTISAMLWLFASGVSPSAEAATAYRCTTPDGQVVYTELPPTGARCQPLTARGYSPSTSTNTPPAAAPQPEAAEPAPEAVADEQQQRRQRACSIARRNLSLLESDQSVIRTNADGEQVVLDAEQRAAALAQARKDIDYWCEDAS